MRIHKSVTIPPKKCFHGIPMEDDCIKCIEYFIRDHQTSIKLLRQTLATVKKYEEKTTDKKGNTKLTGKEAVRAMHKIAKRFK